MLQPLAHHRLPPETCCPSAGTTRAAQLLMPVIEVAGFACWCKCWPASPVPCRRSAESRTSTGLRVLSEFSEGEVVAGRVRRVEKFGVFVELEGSNVVGVAAVWV